jgi:hypothetical protein
MSKQRSVALANITSAAANAAVGVTDFEDATLFVTGTFVGTYEVYESGDGTNFAPTYSANTAPEAFALQRGTSHVKVNCSAYTSGTIKSHVGGVDAERAG